MTPAFLSCHEVTAKWEGGWSYHPQDPGKQTMFGVTQVVYDAFRRREGRQTRSVRKIARAEALDIYYTEYWSRAGCETLISGVDLAHYDAAVNSGVGRARKWLQKAIGPHDASETVRRYCRQRLSFVQGLRTWRVFGRGWSRRIANIEAIGVARATAAQSASGEAVAEKLTMHAAEAKRTSKNQEIGAAGAGGAGATPITLEVFTPDQLASSTAFAIVAIWLLAMAYLIWRSQVNVDRAAAYAEAAYVSKDGGVQI